jgi:hypothetical protein
MMPARPGLHQQEHSMPLPHQQAAIDAATGRRRERLIEAAALLDRIRAENPGVENVHDFPAEVRDAVVQAVRALKPRTRFGFRELVVIAFLAIALGAQWLKPVRMFRCAPQAPGLAQCLVADRMLGVVRRRDQVVSGIASSNAKSAEISAARDRDGQMTATAKRVEEIALYAADGTNLWSASEESPIGASLEQVDADVKAIVAGERKHPALRIQAFWPVLLLSTVFLLFSLNPLIEWVGAVLRDWEVIPYGVYRIVFLWGGFLLTLALGAAAWALVLLGSDPPALVARLVGLD